MGLFEDLTGQVQPSPAALPNSPTSGSLFSQLVSTLPSGPQTSTPEDTYKPPPSAPHTPWGYITGMVSHIPSDLSGVIKGTLDLGQAVVHDVVGATEQTLHNPVIGLPGQGILGVGKGLQQDVQQNGYRLVNIAQALPHMLQQDYASRYGFHGIAEAANQIYAHPLSYVFDALLAGDALAGAAKFMDAGAYEAIRGVTPAAESVATDLTKVGATFGKEKPITNVASIIPTEGANIADTSGVIGIPVSINPVKRFVQNQVIKNVLTRSAEDALNLLKTNPTMLGLSEMGANSPGLLGQTEDVLSKAAAAGTPVLQPFAQRFLTSGFVKRTLGVASQEFYAARNESMLQLKGIMDRAVENGSYVKGEGTLFHMAGEAQPGAFKQALEMTDRNLEATRNGFIVPVPDGMPNNAPIQMDLQGVRSLAPQEVPMVSHIPDPNGITDPEILYALKGESLGAEPSYMVTQHNGPGMKGDLRFNVPVPELKDGPIIAQRLAAETGSNLIGVRDYMGETNLWKGTHYFFEHPTKGIWEANIATPALLDAQKIASDVLWHGTDMQGLMDQTDRALAALAPDSFDEAKILRDQYLRAQDEIQASLEVGKRAMDRPMRLLNHPDGYDPLQMTVDELYAWEYKWGTKPYVNDYLQQYPDWAARGLEGPYTTVMQRAFAPMRFKTFHDMMAQWEGDFQTAIHLANGDPEAAKLHIMDVLQEWGVDELSQSRIAEPKFPLTTEPTIAKSGREMRAGSQILRDRATQLFRKTMLEDGTAPGWDWQSFREAMPQTPNYFPHIRASDVKRSDFLAGVTKALRDNPAPPTFSRGWKGIIEENGAALTDPFEAYGRVAAAYLRHKELGDVVDKVTTMGRLIDKKELMSFDMKQWKSEVLFAPEAIKRKLSLHGGLLDEIYAGVREGKNYMDASMQAIENMLEQVRMGILEDMGTAKVYAIPRAVADAMRAKFLNGFAPGAMRLFFDGPMNLWRSSVLGLNPRWLIYNEMGNIVFTGIKNPLALRRLFGAMSDQNEAYINTVMQFATEPGSETSVSAAVARGGFATTTNAQMSTRFGSAYDTFPKLTKFADATLDNSLVKGTVSKFSNFIRTKNAALEQLARKGLALDAYAEARVGRFAKVFQSNLDIASTMAKDGITHEDFTRMLASANKTLGDYITMNAFERDVVRRFLVPFYPFYRHILKFTLRMPWENPLKTDLFRLLNETDKTFQADLPDYLQGSIYMGQLANKDVYWRIQNWNPLQFFADEQMNPLSAFNPFLRMGIQATTSTDEFGQPYQAPDVYDAGNGQLFKLGAPGTLPTPFEGQQHPAWPRLIAEQFGLPFSLINLHGYQNRNLQTQLAGLGGLSLSRFDTAHYQTQTLLNQLEALTHQATHPG